eukprot:3184888-Rhodomonas_salina.1
MQSSSSIQLSCSLRSAGQPAFTAESGVERGVRRACRGTDGLVFPEAVVAEGEAPRAVQAPYDLPFGSIVLVASGDAVAEQV